MNLKKFLTFIFTCIIGLNAGAQSADTHIQLADPTIFYHQGTYYLYGTGSKPYNNGFVVYTSTDLKNWQGPAGATSGYAFAKGDGFGTDKFWAPQVFQYADKFYMAYTASEHIGIAMSSSPLGPFKRDNKTTLIPGQRRIDPFVFIDTDGKKYLYHVLVANGGNRIFVAELKDDFSGIKPETLIQCIEATETWENTEKEDWSVTEGPTVIKQNDTYYLLYSANHFKSKDYAVGYATSKSPYGPWVKCESSPIISRKNIHQNGVGHGDLFQDAKGDWKYVLHTHYSDTAISPRLTAVVDASFKGGKRHPKRIKIKSGTFHFLKK